MIEPWNDDIWRNLIADRDRAAHALLFCGAAGLGKINIASRYAEKLLGDSHRFSAVSHPDFHVLGPEAELDTEGSLLQRYGMRYYRTRATLKPKSVISVDQVRALTNTIVNYAHGSVKVVLVSPAHRMNINAANALLKSLEEPPTDTVFILISDRPDQLPATIRSRCSRVDFRVPSRAVGLSWLSGKTDDARATLALDVACGAPLLAEEYLHSGFLEARETVIRDIQSALSGRIDITTLPTKWKDVGISSALVIFHGVLSDLVRAAYVHQPPGLNNPDQLDWLQRTAKGINLKEVFALTGRIGTYLRDTNSPLDKSLVLEDLLFDLDNIGKT